jgi:hypothetical protein
VTKGQNCKMTIKEDCRISDVRYFKMGRMISEQQEIENWNVNTMHSVKEPMICTQHQI